MHFNDSNVTSKPFLADNDEDNVYLRIALSYRRRHVCFYLISQHTVQSLIEISRRSINPLPKIYQDINSLGSIW